MTPGASVRSAAQARRLISPLLRSWYRVAVVGAEHVPTDGPVLAVANHSAFLDEPLLLSASPRPLRVLTDEATLVPPLDRLVRAAGQIRVRTAGPDRRAFDQALGTLEDGGAVGAFAELRPGDGRVRRVAPEIAYLALVSGAAVVPVSLLGTRKSGAGADAVPRRRSRLGVVFGEPFRLGTGQDPQRRSVIAAAAETLRQRLADLLADAQETTGMRLPTDETTEVAR